jgi:ribosomal protein S3
MVKSSCDRLTLEDHAACEDTLVNVYELTQDELQSPLYKNLTLKSFRIPLKVTNPGQVLGQAPIAVQNFKATVEYRYLLERSATVSVREVPKV